MCGITGFLDKVPSKSRDELARLVTHMSDCIRHRGPDDEGIWCDETAGLALGFRRLAILDLSPTGRQPMLSAGERYVIIYNGEIYNHNVLRQELVSLGHAFRGTSDTEVILAAILQWGLDAAVKRLNGMFAFALWDRSEHALHLVRDRLGIKPLYYSWVGDTFLFGSELKSLRAHPAFKGEIDRNALALYLRYNYIPAPFSIYVGIHKLLPGSILTIRSTDDPRAAAPAVYWSARQVVEAGVANPFQGNEREATDALEALLRRSIGLRMIADVPLGAFLSGGIDSSTVVAMMQVQSSRPVQTFTIGFNEAGFDEALYARAVARHLHTDHTELYVSPEETRDVIPLLSTLYDEPFSDSSQIPIYLVSRLARQSVTVSLSGDGGDELFGGYNRYFAAPRIWNRVGWLPIAARRAIARGILSISPSTWGNWLARTTRLPNPADKAQKLADVIQASGISSIYQHLVSHWDRPTEVALNSVEPGTPATDPARWAQVDDFAEQMMYMDLITYLPDDVLCKVDRASMGVSLEARAPFLDDHEVVEFAWRLPLSMKIRNGAGKWILRQVLYRHVPKAMIDRPKMGFGVPLDAWLRGPLRDWGETLLDESCLRQQGYLRPESIRQKWAEHLSGARNWQYLLWDVLMFQAWLAQTQ